MEKPSIFKTITDRVKTGVGVGIVAGVVANAIPPKAPKEGYTEPVHSEYSYTSPSSSFLSEDSLYSLSSGMTEKFTQKLYDNGYSSIEITHIETHKSYSDAEGYILLFKGQGVEKEVTVTMSPDVFKNKYKVEEFFLQTITKELDTKKAVI